MVWSWPFDFSLHTSSRSSVEFGIAFDRHEDIQTSVWLSYNHSTSHFRYCSMLAPLEISPIYSNKYSSEKISPSSESLQCCEDTIIVFFSLLVSDHVPFTSIGFCEISAISHEGLDDSCSSTEKGGFVGWTSSRQEYAQQSFHLLKMSVNTRNVEIKGNKFKAAVKAVICILKWLPVDSRADEFSVLPLKTSDRRNCRRNISRTSFLSTNRNQYQSR